MGTSLRYGLGVSVARAWGESFPYGTFAANILGGFFMGVLAGWLVSYDPI